MKKFASLALLLVATVAWATIPNHSFHLVLTPSGKADSRYPDGNDGTGAIPLTWAHVPDISVVNGATGSVNLASSYLTQAGSPTATLATTCSTPLPTGGFSFSDPTLSWSSTTTTAISCTTTATRLTATATTNQFSLTSVSGAAADTTAPVTPSISSVTCPSTTECDITVLPMNDPAIPGATTSGLKDVRIYRNGTLITTQAVSAGLSLPLADVAIGGATGGSAVQTGASFALTSNGNNIYGTSDQADFLTVATPISGDFDIVFYVSAWTNADQFAKVAAGVRKTLAANSQAVWALLFPTAQAQGVNVEQRSSTGVTATQQVGLSGIKAPLCIRLQRVVATSAFVLYTSPDCNSWTTRQSTTLAMTDPVYPGILLGNGTAGTMTVTASRVSINNLASIVYQDTGLTAGTTYTYTVDARDLAGTPNVATVSAAASGTTVSGGVTAPTWPRLGSYLIGGGPRDYGSTGPQTWLSMQDAAVIAVWNGWQGSGQSAVNWTNTVAGINTNSPLPIKTQVFAYFDWPQIYPATATASATNDFTANNWFLKTTYPSGSVVKSSCCNLINMYYPGGSTNSGGLAWWQYEARYILDINYTGGSYGLGTGGNSAAPALSGIYSDDLFYYSLLGSGDFNRDGTTDSNSNQTFWPGWQAGERKVWDEIASLKPALQKSANLSQFSQTASVPQNSQFLGYFDSGVLESIFGLSYSPETWGGFSEAATEYAREWTLLKGQKLGIVGAHVTGLNGADQTDSTPYRAAWYGMTFTWVMGDGLYFANVGDTSTYDINVRTWFDYYAVDPSTGVAQTYSSGVTAGGLKWLGTPNGPAVALGSGLYGRFWTNGAHGGVCVVNPKGNGTQNITTTMLGGSGIYRRVTGTQRPTWDTGATVSGNISIVARDGICLEKI